MAARSAEQAFEHIDVNGRSEPKAAIAKRLNFQFSAINFVSEVGLRLLLPYQRNSVFTIARG